MILFDDLKMVKKNYYLSGVVGDFAWAVVAAPLYGAYNGYIRLPDGHPWLSINDPMFNTPCEVNGGITYKQGNWFGFDTMHSWDVWPETPFYATTGNAIHWTPNMVVSETKQFLDQAIVVMMENQLQ